MNMVRRHPIKIVLTFDERTRVTAYVSLLIAIESRVSPKRKVARKKKQKPSENKIRLVYIPTDRFEPFIIGQLFHSNYQFTEYN